MKLSPVPGRPDLLIYTTQAGFIHLLDLRSEKEAWVFKRRPHTGVNSALVVGQDGKWLASATNCGFVANCGALVHRVSKDAQQLCLLHEAREGARGF